MIRNVDYLKLYVEEETGNIYRFDRVRYKEIFNSNKEGDNKSSLFNKAEECKEFNKGAYDNKDKLSNEDIDAILEKLTSIPTSSLSKFRNNGNDERMPESIADCRIIGEILCGNEYAFLRRYEDISNEKSINEIYSMVYEIFDLYDNEDRFNKRCDLSNSEEIMSYNEYLDNINKAIELKLLLLPKETIDYLKVVINECRIFINNFSLPGVVDRWFDFNPNLRFYDPVFEIMETNFKFYEEIRDGKYKNIKFRFIPTVQDLKDKKNYFKKLEEDNTLYNVNYSEVVFYKDELIKTITSIFSNIVS